MRRADGDDDGDGYCKASSASRRCLDAARYTVAAVVTMLILTVTVVALKVALRPESLRLSVVDGSVYSTPRPATKTVYLYLNIRAENPSGRARMYLVDVAAYLFDGAAAASTPTPEDDCVIFFNPDDEAVRQQMAVDCVTSVEGTDDPGVMDPEYYDLLYAKRGVIGGATLRVDATLVTEVSSGLNRTHRVIYYCRPLLVGGSKGGGDAAASTGRNDVLCTDSLGSM